MGSLPNLRNVILTDTLSTRDLPNEQIQGFSTWNIGPASPLEECTLSDAQHQDFQVEPASGFVAYEKKRKEEESLHNSGEFVVHLCSTLSKAKNLRKLIIGEPENLYNRPEFDRNELFVGDFDDCILHREECLPDHFSDRWPCALDLLHPAMLALDKFGSAITEIDMEYIRDWDVVLTSLAFSAFDSSGLLARSLAHVLPRLTKLHLAFDVSSNDGIGEPCYNLAGVNETCFFRGDVAMDDDNPAGKGTVNAVLGGCKFPKLTSSILEGLDPAGDKLEEFLLASPKLEYLFLHNVKVISGLKDFMLHIIDDVKTMDYLPPSKDNPLTPKEPTSKPSNPLMGRMRVLERINEGIESMEARAWATRLGAHYKGMHKGIEKPSFNPFPFSKNFLASMRVL